MQAFQERVVEEKTELDAKIAKLKEFIAGSIYPTLDVEEQTRLTLQLSYMEAYSEVLGQRIVAFV